VPTTHNFSAYALNELEPSARERAIQGYDAHRAIRFGVRRDLARALCERHALPLRENDISLPDEWLQRSSRQVFVTLTLRMRPLLADERSDALRASVRTPVTDLLVERYPSLGGALGWEARISSKSIRYSPTRQRVATQFAGRAVKALYQHSRSYTPPERFMRAIAQEALALDKVVRAACRAARGTITEHRHRALNADPETLHAYLEEEGLRFHHDGRALSDVTLCEITRDARASHQ
jgi:hypothetical protein